MLFLLHIQLFAKCETLVQKFNLHYATDKLKITKMRIKRKFKPVLLLKVKRQGYDSALKNYRLPKKSISFA